MLKDSVYQLEYLVGSYGEMLRRQDGDTETDVTFVIHELGATEWDAPSHGIDIVYYGNIDELGSDGFEWTISEID